MKLKIIYSTNDSTAKWIIREKNIQGKKLIGITNFSDIRINTVFSIHDRVWLKYFIDGVGNSHLISSDRFRNLTIEEYNTFSMILKIFGYKYNKKKDEFIKIIDDEY